MLVAAFNKISQVLSGRYGLYLRFLISGAVAAVADIGSLYLLTDFIGLWYLNSAILAFMISLVVSFSLQKFWTFNDQRIDSEIVRKQGLAYIMLAIVNLLANTSLMYVFVDVLKWHYLVSQIIAGILIAISSFLIYRNFIFKREI